MRFTKIAVLSLILAAMLSARNDDPVDMGTWKKISCVVGRAAAQEDVNAGRAVFCLNGPASGIKPIDLNLPRCAIWHDGKTKADIPVIVIQAEAAGPIRAAGCRFLTGKDGVCSIS